MHISCLAAILPRRYVSRILVSTLSIVLIAISASAQDLDWAKLAYGTGSDGGTRYDWGRGVASLNDGSTAILGEFQEDLTLGFGEANETTLRGRAGNVFNLFVARYNPDGTLAWAKQTNGQARPGKIAAFPDRSIIITGYLSSYTIFGEGEPNETSLSGGSIPHTFIARYNSDGTLDWAVQTTGSGESGSDIAALADGTFLVTGGFGAEITFDPGGPSETTLTSADGGDYYFAHYDADARLIWAVQDGGDRINAVAAFDDGSAVITGGFWGSATFGSGEPNEITLIADQSSGNYEDIFVARYNPDGSLAWAKKAGGRLDMEYGNSVATFPDGSCVVTGRFTYQATFGTDTVLSSGCCRRMFVARYNPDGSLAWAKKADGDSEGKGIATYTDGTFVVAGLFGNNGASVILGPGEADETILSDGSGFVAGYHADGTLKWARRAGVGPVTGYHISGAYDVAAFDDGSAVAVGSLAGIETFGVGEPNETVIASVDNGDVWVARYKGGNTPPVAVCKNVMLCADESCSGSASIDDGSYDPDGDEITITQSPEGPYELGDTSVVLTVTDSTGASSQCTATVTINDEIAPELTAPPDVLAATGPGAVSCGTELNDEDLGDANVSDNCGGVITISRDPDGYYFPVGETTLLYKATDGNGNSATDNQSVKVEDTTVPSISVPENASIEGNIPGQCGANLDPGFATAVDNCSSEMNIEGTRSDGMLLSEPYPLDTTVITWSATDAAGNESSDDQLITVTNPSPEVVISGPPTGSIFPVGIPVSFTGSYVDNPGGSPTAIWTFGSMTLNGTINEETGAVGTSYAFNAAGVYNVTLTVQDGCDGSGTSSEIGGLQALVVIYDPNGGFVTGGGWIYSPAGAYAANPSLTGKANFGFVSKYQNGAQTPTGQTEFHFKVADFEFHSSSYDWLVVAGARAKYKGVGTINDGGNYGFMLTGIDGQLPGGNGEDKFRIKIWDKNNNDAVVYDNQMSMDDEADPVALLGGGNIVIHK